MICVVPDDGDGELCGAPATHSAVVEGVVCPLCAEHHAEVAAEDAEAKPRPNPPPGHYRVWSPGAGETEDDADDEPAGSAEQAAYAEMELAYEEIGAGSDTIHVRDSAGEVTTWACEAQVSVSIHVRQVRS